MLDKIELEEIVLVVNTHLSTLKQNEIGTISWQ